MAKNWKANLKNPILNIKQGITLNTLRTSYVSSSLLNTILAPPTTGTKIILHGFTENTIQKVYLVPFGVTNEVKVIMVQYKVIHDFQPVLHFIEMAFQKAPYATYATLKSNCYSTC